MKQSTKRLMNNMGKKEQVLKEKDLFNNVNKRRPLSDTKIEDKIEELLKFFEGTGIDYAEIFDKDNKGDSGLFNALNEKKIAYPNVDYYMQVPGQRDTKKWIETIKNIYQKEKNGINRIAAIRELTNGWQVTETFDFLNWLRYYEEGSHIKYKYAQLWYENGKPGYFLPINKINEETQIENNQDIQLAQESAQLSKEDKKRIIEKQRRKIIGRLDSAEKLLRSDDGQLFADKELESLLEIIYQLKKKIQMINKISLSTSLYDDLIVREGNVLKKRGFLKAANFIYTIAQAAPTSTPELPNLNLPDSEKPIETPKMDSNGVPLGIKGFLDNLETATITVEDDNSNNDHDLMVVEAQIKTPPPLKNTPSVSDTSMEVTENGTPDATISNQGKDFDHMIDAAFSNLKVDDIVAKLEDLAKIFKTREIPRQLSIVDMMLDSLGLASYFPELSEACNRALESNNYIGLRVEDILSKLRGVTRTRDIDLTGQQKEVNPEVENIKNNLKSQEEKEKNRKEQRKEKQNQELDQEQKETPEIEIQEDLNQPTTPTPKIPKPITTPR